MRHRGLYTTLGIALLYASAAQLSFLLRLPGWQFSLIWPHPGIALAAVLLLGRAALPGIFLGALVTNVFLLLGTIKLNLIAVATVATPTKLGIAVAISAASTLVPFVAARALRIVAPRAPLWASAREVVLGTLVMGTASVIYVGGVASIRAFDMLPQDVTAGIWAMWWLANFCGMLIFAPFAFILGQHVLAGTRTSQSGAAIGPTLLYSAAAALALTVYMALWTADTEEISAQLSRESKLAANNTAEVLRNAQRDLEGLRALFSASTQVTRAQFRRFLLAHNGDTTDRPQARAKVWIPHVTDRAAWEASMQRELGRPVTIFQMGRTGGAVPAEQRENYFPVEFIEPLDQFNRGAVGFDVSSEALRRAALDYARDTGKAGMTVPITLRQTQLPDPVMQLCLGVYARGTTVQSVDARRAGLTGFICGAYPVHSVFAKSLVAARGDIDLYLFDLSNAAPVELYRASAAGTRTEGKPDGGLATLAGLRLRAHGMADIHFAGQQWLVLASPGPAFIDAQRTWTPWGAMTLLLSLGLVVTCIRVERLAADQQMEGERRKTEQALIAAREANKAQDFFMAAASHDIKQPAGAGRLPTLCLWPTHGDRHRNW
ncbi:MAG: CHASE domain-containing protein [Halioglobus sp.]